MKPDQLKVLFTTDYCLWQIDIYLLCTRPETKLLQLINDRKNVVRHLDMVGICVIKNPITRATFAFTQPNHARRSKSQIV